MPVFLNFRTHLGAVLLGCILFVTGTATAQTELWHRLPIDRSSAVQDFAGLIPPADEAQLNQFLIAFERRTGAALAVVTVDSMEGGQVDDFANRLYERMGLGRQGEDRGVLFFVAERERRWRVEVGYGLEAVITDGTAARIAQDRAVPAFRAGDYARGIGQTLGDIARRIDPESASSVPALSRSPESRSEDGDITTNWPFLLLVIFIVILRMMGARNRRRLRGRRGGTYVGSFGGGGFGGGGSFAGGGFGGFGGGLSGGGGASGGW